VISSNPLLLAHRPDAVKMVLMLTAHNVEGGYWDCTVDQRDGAGTISAYDAVAYAVTCTDLTNTPTPGAVEHGFFTTEADSSMAERRFDVRIPDTLPNERHLRVALTWTSVPLISVPWNQPSDLDLGGFVADSGAYGSYSLDANVEMFDVPRNAVTPGRTYSFSVYPRCIRIPPGARTNFFYYTVGWTWVRDHADSAVTGIARQPLGNTRQGRFSAAARAVSSHVIRVALTSGGSGRLTAVSVTNLAGRAHRVRDWQRVGRDLYEVRLESALAHGIYLLTVQSGQRRATVRCSHAR
jgi:hypothetical protein